MTSPKGSARGSAPHCTDPARAVDHEVSHPRRPRRGRSRAGPPSLRESVADSRRLRPRSAAEREDGHPPRRVERRPVASVPRRRRLDPWTASKDGYRSPLPPSAPTRLQGYRSHGSVRRLRGLAASRLRRLARRAEGAGASVRPARKSSVGDHRRGPGSGRIVLSSSARPRGNRGSRAAPPSRATPADSREHRLVSARQAPDHDPRASTTARGQHDPAARSLGQSAAVDLARLASAVPLRQQNHRRLRARLDRALIADRDFFATTSRSITSSAVLRRRPPALKALGDRLTPSAAALNNSTPA